jgi:hypothetical protein
VPFTRGYDVPAVKLGFRPAWSVHAPRQAGADRSGAVTVTEISHCTVYLAWQVIAGRAVEPAYGVYTTVGGM